MSPSPWWKGAICYQIYPRSFLDSNGDGIGDLKGITSKLDYIADLGVDAVWISPFFKSPMKDFGYDISDYRDVDPIFGTLDDFQTLLHEAHSRDLKIIIDLVLSHTSDQHDWFVESRACRDNRKSDWYVWAEPKDDGSPPNNWHSLFGGPAWTFDTRRGQYYLHNFLQSQPDLNMHNPHVQDAVLDVVRFWLDMGVDGLRLDVVNFYFHDQDLRNNPPRPPELGSAVQFDKPEPYNMQAHIYDKSRPENLAFLEKLRTLMDEYGERMAMGEIGDDDPFARVAEYTQGQQRLHTAYNLALLEGLKRQVTAPFIRDVIEPFNTHAPDSWPTWAFSNHDVVRSASRWAPTGHEHNPDFAVMVIALLISLRGTVFLYQGEELGLNDVSVAYDDIQDPWGRVLWPEWQGRDGCRTPMPWDERAPNLGFSRTNEKPWLPLGGEHAHKTVSEQNALADSCLNQIKDLIAFRKQNPLFTDGDMRFDLIDGRDYLMRHSRSDGDQTIIFIANLDADPVTVQQPGLPGMGMIKTSLNPCESEGETLSIPGFGWCFLESE